MANVWNPIKNRWEDPENGNVLIGGAPGPNGTWAGGTWTNAGGGTFVNGTWADPAAHRQVADSEARLSAKEGVYAAQGPQLQARYGVQQAQRGVLGARQQTLGPQQGVINANRGVQAAQQAALGGQRGLINTSMGELSTQRGEFEQEQAAKLNTPDLAAVAMAQRYRSAQDARDRSFGITPSIDIDAAPGTVRLGEDIAPGVRAKLSTQEQDVTQANQTAKTRRGFDIESAKLAVQLMSSDVDQARLVAAQAGLTLDQAQLAVSAAENAAGFAGNAEDLASLGVSTAQRGETRASLDSARLGLDESIADLPPFKGAERYTDPYTGRQSYMTPNEADKLQNAYSNDLGTSRVTSDYATKVNRQNITDTLEGQGGFAQQGPAGPLDIYSIPALLNMYIDPKSYTTGLAPNANRPAVEEAIIKQLLKDKRFPTVDIARSTARQLLENELADRLNKAAASNTRPPPAANSGTTVN